jgi:hypothetical protein
MKKILLLLFLGASLVSAAQRHTISGYVTDKKTGERLVNANVYEQTTLKGSTANSFGFFSISLPAGKVTLVASFIGYQPNAIEINLEKDVVFNFELLSSSDEIEEVVVVGNKSNKVEETQMSMMDIPIQKLQKIPVILGEADVLKVIQLLPGVQSGTEGTSGIYVRGGGPDQNLFLLDGVPVYNAGHLLGFFSVFNPDALKTVKLYKGGFPARFGGRLSSVVDITMKDGNMKKFEGNFSIGIISSKLSFEGPIIKDKTSFIVSARRTYLDLMAAPVIAYMNKREETNVWGGAFFHDYNMKVNHIFNDRSRLYLSAYFGKDKGYGRDDYTYENSYNDVKTKIQYEDKFGLSWGNTIASLRWNYIINNKLFSNSTLTYSKYIFDIGIESMTKDFIENTRNDNVFRYYSGIEDWAAKVDFDYFPLPGHEVKFGAHYTNHLFTPGVTKLRFVNQDVNTSEVLDTTLFGNREIYANEISTYIEDDITLSDKMNLNVGLHLSTFIVDSKTYFRLQPRLAYRYRAGENWSLKASYSRMAQHVHLLTTSGISLPTDLWLPVTKTFEPPISDQVAIGTAINLPRDFTLTIEGFYKTMQNLIEYKEGASFTGSATNWESKVEMGRGWSYGGEFMIEKTVGKTTGWIGYTLSWTNRQFDKLNFGNVFPAKYDRRHDLSVVLTHTFSDKFDIGGTWVYGTGNAVTLGVMKYPRFVVPDQSSWHSSELQDYGGRNNFRMPAYHRMDIGMNFHKKKKYGTRTWSLSAYNAYNRQNPFILMWNTKSDWGENEKGEWVQLSPTRTVLSQFSLFPIIPSISYSYKF